MTIEYRPEEVTDWTEELDKIYARQSAQLDNHYANLRERDRQKQEAQIDWVDTIVKLADFSKTVADVKNARDASKEKKDAENLNRVKVDYLKNEHKEEVERLTKWRTDETNLKKDFREFEIEVKKSIKEGKLTDKSGKILLDNHGGNIVYLQEMFGQQILDNSYGVINSGFKLEEGDEGAKRQVAWEAAGDDPGEQRKIVEGYLFKKLKALNFSDDLIKNKYIDQISDIGKNKQILAKIKVQDRRLTETNLQDQQRFDLARKNIDTEPNGLSFETALQKKTKGNDKSLFDLTRAGELGHLTDTELAGMKEGLIEHPAGDIVVTEKNKDKYPGFKVGAKLGKGELLYKSKEWDQIEAGISRYNKVQVAQRDSGIQTIATNAMATIDAGEQSIEELQTLKDETLLTISRTLGKNSDEYRALESRDVTFQSKESYAATRQEYIGFYNGSRLGELLQNKENFKNIPNKRVSKELLDFVAKAEKDLSGINLPITQEGWDKRGRASIITSPAQQDNFKSDSTFSNDTIAIQTELAQKELEFHLSMLSKFDDPLEAKGQAEKLFEAWKIEQGFNIKDDGLNPDKVGRLSPNEDGEYARAKAIRAARVENDAKPSTYLQQHWKVRGQKELKKAGGDVEEMLNKAESYIDKEDALGAFVQPNNTDEFQLFYSPELIVKSLAIGKQPSYVLQQTLKALIADKRYSKYVEKFKLKKKLKLLDNAPDLRLKEILDNLGNQKYIAQYNYGGIMSFTPKQRVQLIELEKKLNNPENNGE